MCLEFIKDSLYFLQENGVLEENGVRHLTRKEQQATLHVGEFCILPYFSAVLVSFPLI